VALRSDIGAWRQSQTLLPAGAVGERALEESAVTAKRIWDGIAEVWGKEWAKQWGKRWGKELG
jgi:hypothetical protein